MTKHNKAVNADAFFVRCAHCKCSEQFVGLLERSSLSERRPIHNSECMEGVVNNSNLVVRRKGRACVIV